jgi:hypothetical protein
MIIPDSEGGGPLLTEATRELEAAIHDARVAGADRQPSRPVIAKADARGDHGGRLQERRPPALKQDGRS